MEAAVTRRIADLLALAPALAIVLGAAAPAVAQRPTPPSPPSSHPAAAWLGVGYEVRWVDRGDVCQPRIVVESVIQGAPAERAGLRPGDAIVALQGTPIAAGRLELLASHLTAGDSVRLRVARSGVEREIVAVADRRPARLVVQSLKAPGSLQSADLPTVLVLGDSLIGRNLERLAMAPGGSYAVRHPDGRTEYRRAPSRSGGWSRDELDRRVSRLVACAGRSDWAAHPAPAPHVEQIRLRADSLRVLIGERALTRAAAERATGAAPMGRINAAPPAIGPAGSPASLPPGVSVRSNPDGSFYVLRFEDHAAAAERGVAGAEVTGLEPELARYFRGVDAGVLVLRVSPGTPAEKAGLRPGDVITAGGGTLVADVPTLRRLLALPDARPLAVDVVRHGRVRTLTIRRE